MAEVALVDEHANGCTVCHAVAGPFVVFAVDNLTVQTTEGPIGVSCELTLCAPNDGREGCAGQAARTLGYQPAAVLGHAHDQLTEAYARAEQLEQKVGELEQAQAIREEELAAKIVKKVIAEASAA